MQSIDIDILHAVFLFSRANRRFDATTLGIAARVSATRAGVALCALERAGLVDASRARLTMLGLARAVATGATGSGGGRVQLDRVQAIAPRHEPVPLAARSEIPAPYPSEPAQLAL